MSTQIEGLPLGMKARIGRAKPGETVLSRDGSVEVCDFHPGSGWADVIVVPDNPYNKFLHEVEKDIKAEGREWNGELRIPKQYEDIWTTHGTATKWNGPTSGPRMILKPLKRRVLVMPELPIDAHGNVKLPAAGTYGVGVLVRAGCRIEEREA